MNMATTLSRTRIALGVAAIGVLIGTPVLAKTFATYTSTYDFQIVDPAQPNVEYSVVGNFPNQEIKIQVNLSSLQGVKQLTGSAQFSLLVWNDTANDYQFLQTLGAAKSITLTTDPTVYNFTFTTDQIGSYRVLVSFTATGYELA
jgi:uncharacterized protein involved in exopolysaccharide biosynthesis